MQIQLSQLKLLTEKLFAHLEEQGQNVLEISEDYYWNVSKEERYNLDLEPKELTIGQLTDDWAELEKILNLENEPISYDLVWLSSILRFIGEDLIS